MSSGVYALARFLHHDHMIPALNTLSTCPSVVGWDAVDGHVNLVMKLDVPPVDIPAEVLHLNGLAELLIAEIIHETPGAAKQEDSLCRSYLFLETEAGKAADIQAKVLAEPGMLGCAQTAGPFDLVCTMQGATFDALQRVISDRIVPLDGVVRIRQNRIIDLQSL